MTGRYDKSIAVIGLGSMGKRRIRLIRELFPAYGIIGVDAREDRRKEVQEQFGIAAAASVQEIDCKIDCAFVCTPPLSHEAVIRECLENGWHVFTELNLTDAGYEENTALAEDAGLKLFLSSTMLYRRETQYIRSKIGDGKWNYIYHIGQYLPDWHPWEDYRDFFAAKKGSNGCREILAIELPWLLETFGAVEEISSASGRMSDLDLTYDDNYMITIRHANGSKGSLIVDVVSPVAVRKLEAYTDGAYLTWDGTPESVYEFDPASKELKRVILAGESEHADGYRAFIAEEAYKEEIREFIAVVQDGAKPRYDLTKDRRILKMIDRIGA